MKGARTVMIMGITCAAVALAVTVATQDGGTVPGSARPPSSQPVPPAATPTDAQPRERPGARRHPTSGLPLEQVTIGGKAFDLEVAATTAAIERGLGGRSEIPESGGMVFVFPGTSNHNFWMRDCLVDIDIAFLDPRGTVVAVHSMRAEPLRQPSESEADYYSRLTRYPSGPRAQFAIETRAGTNEALGIKVGSAIPIEPTRLLSLRRDAAPAPPR